jgi:hypothetical protein
VQEVKRGRPDEDIPSFEPWVITVFAAFLPVGLGFVFPSLMWPLFVVAGIVFIVGVVMWLRDERARAAIAAEHPPK